MNNFILYMNEKNTPVFYGMKFFYQNILGIWDYT